MRQKKELEVMMARKVTAGQRRLCYDGDILPISPMKNSLFIKRGYAGKMVELRPGLDFLTSVWISSVSIKLCVSIELEFSSQID